MLGHLEVEVEGPPNVIYASLDTWEHFDKVLTCVIKTGIVRPNASPVIGYSLERFRYSNIRLSSSDCRHTTLSS
ncbi:unnamed protein product [Periconia digitata]|uniref:Uncharacterized protein n=1 Tax=Periconia digitata TaxID=1303443 RepID=A0A9W4UA19_9PLEO|nr:unnamed protein product [Periconia digitata]